MRTSQRTMLKLRVNAFLGSLLLLSWTLGCSLVLWQAATDENPLANAFAKSFYAETYLAVENN
jgi:uncharacterized Tic20 family protein